ncbi:MAG: hypothetical protein ACEQSQ_11480 [Candidatus Paceibacteria bacterium]|jgi:hypothetical protein
MNLTKAIKKLSEDIESSETLEDAKLHLTKVLKSYEYQTQNGLDKIESFLNSIYTPSAKEKSKSQFSKIKSHKKYAIAIRYEYIIKEEREKNMSDAKIATILNSRYVHKQDYFNRQYINRFRKEKGIA